MRASGTAQVVERVTTLLGKAPLDHYCPVKVKQGRKGGRRDEGQNHLAPNSSPAPHILNVALAPDPLPWPPHRHAPWNDLKGISPSCPSLPPCIISSPRWWPGCHHLFCSVRAGCNLVWLQLQGSLGLSWVTHLFPSTLSNQHGHRHTWSMERLLTGDSISHTRCSVLGWHPLVPHGLEMPHGPPVQQPQSSGLLCFLVMLMAKIITTIFVFFFFLIFFT